MQNVNSNDNLYNESDPFSECTSIFFMFKVYFICFIADTKFQVTVFNPPASLVDEVHRQQVWNPPASLDQNEVDGLKVIDFDECTIIFFILYLF